MRKIERNYNFSEGFWRKLEKITIILQIFQPKEALRVCRYMQLLTRT